MKAKKTKWRCGAEASAARIVDHVIAQVRQHTGLNRRIDDITVVVMRVG